MTRLKQYERGELESLPCAGAPDASLRGLVRAEIAAGNITGVTGTMVAGMDKGACISLLLGESAPMAATPAAPMLATSAAPMFAPQGGGDAGPGLVPLAAMLAPYLQGMISPAPAGVDAEEIRALAVQVFGDQVEPSIASARAGCAEAVIQMAEAFGRLKEDMLKRRPVEITVRKLDGSKLELGRQHFLFPLLATVASTRSHAYLVGPAGSGKTTVCHKVANALGLPFRTISVCQQSTKTDLLGYMDATGNYRSTAFRDCYEKGGVFVMDEIDNGNANTIAVANGALANDGMDFPDARVTRHPDFVFIAAGNTYGSGADRLYVGRNQLDAATLDRFAFIDFPYDEGFEMELCGVHGAPSPALDIEEGGPVRADEWLAFVQAVRAAVESVKVRHVVSPRASIYGCKLAAAGIGRAHLERMLIWKGLDAATVAKVRAAIK